MTKLLTITALFALAVPAAFAAPSTQSSAQSAAQSPAQQCKAQRQALGVQAFQSTYGGGKNAMGKCVSQQAQAAAADVQNAARTCKAERAQNPTAFRDKYGTNPNKANALGKCVSQLAGERAAERQEGMLNAAKKCKAERAQNPTAFRDKYGTNPNKANALGKCVSQEAKKTS
jgi:hypothetical protein